MLGLNGLEAPAEVQINTVTQQTTQQNTGKPRPICLLCKKAGHYRNQCCKIKQERDQVQNNTNSVGNNNDNNGGQTNSNSDNQTSNITNAINTNNRNDRKSGTV